MYDTTVILFQQERHVGLDGQKEMFSSFSSEHHLFSRAKHFCVILVEGVMGYFVRNYFELRPLLKDHLSLKYNSTFNSGDHFVQQS